MSSVMIENFSNSADRNPSLQHHFLFVDEGRSISLQSYTAQSCVLAQWDVLTASSDAGRRVISEYQSIAIAIKHGRHSMHDSAFGGWLASFRDVERCKCSSQFRDYQVMGAVHKLMIIN